MLLSKYLNKKGAELTEHQKKSYSQCGEDLIVRFIFSERGIQNPTYIDVGAHHPHYLNNTALFYEMGSRGINIEPDPILFAQFSLHRKNDVNLNMGIADQAGALDFYKMSAPTLNTFQRTEAEKYEAESGYKIVGVEKINVNTLEWVLNAYTAGKFPDFLTLDVEGLDEVILSNIQYEHTRPTVICVETISFSESGRGHKQNNIIEYLKSKGYIVFADTYINTIFVYESFWVI